MSNNAKRFTKEKNDREVRRLFTKFNKMQHDLWHLPKITLDKPRFVGWQRFYVLRDDISRRKDVKDIRAVLDMVNTTRYSKTKDFSQHDAYQHIYPSKQCTANLSDKQFEKLNEIQKKFFYKEWNGKKKYTYWSFYPQYFFVFKIKRHYITEVQVLDAELESRIQEIQNKIIKLNLWPKIHKLMGWRMYKGYDYNAPRFRFIDKMVKKAVEEVYFTDPIRENDLNKPIIENMDY